MDLSICIVNWNTKELLRQCLKSIYKKTVGIDFDIIVVDNASQDGSVEMLREEFPQCTAIGSNDNLGFSKANNLAIKKTKGKYILFLNPDTELKTNALAGMVMFLEKNSEYGAVGCKLLNRDESIQFTCARKFPSPFKHLCFLLMIDRIFPGFRLFSTTEMGYWDHLDSREVDCLSGACILTRKNLLDQIGGFDENFFMYGEDVELCYRIKKNGWRISYLAEEEIFHFSGASSSQRKETSFSSVMQLESNYKFMARNYGEGKAFQFRISTFIGSLFRMIFIFIILPIISIYEKNQKEKLTYSLKKYSNIFLWSIKA